MKNSKLMVTGIVVLIVAIAVSLFVFLPKSNIKNEDSSSDMDSSSQESQESQESFDQDIEESDYLYTNETLGFSILFPAEWEESCIVSEATEIVSFQHKENYEQEMGGLLFSVGIWEKGEEAIWPSCEKIGELDDIEYYIIYASDVQYSAELEESYYEMFNEIEDIMENFVILEE